MRNVTSILVICAVMLFLLYGIMQKKQSLKDFAYINEVIKPAVAYVEDFQKKNSRLPESEDFSRTELKSRYCIDILKEKESFQDKDFKYFKDGVVIPEGEYIIWFWRGEWAELYYSETGKIYCNSKEYDLDSSYILQ